MRSFLAKHWAALGRRVSPRDVTDREALAAIIRVAGGTLRRRRLVTQSERIQRSNERRAVPSGAVAMARSSVVIGAPA